MSSLDSLLTAFSSYFYSVCPNEPKERNYKSCVVVWVALQIQLFGFFVRKVGPFRAITTREDPTLIRKLAVHRYRLNHTLELLEQAHDIV